MADRKKVTHPAPTGYSSAADLARVPKVLVVGGGIAGLSAATALAERGVDVQVVEREDYLGGRVGGWKTDLSDGTTVTMSRGFHAFFRQYYNLRSLLRRTDPGLDRMVAVDDYPLVDGEGRTDTFRGLPQTPPLNAFAFVARSPTFKLRELFTLKAKPALPLMTVNVPATFDQLDTTDAAQFLRDINFPVAAQHLAFGVFSRSFFADPENMSAAELAMMFHIYFLGSTEGLIFDVPDDPYSVALWEPLAAYLEGLGTDIRTGVSCKTIEKGTDRKFRVTTTETTTEFDAIVLSTDVAGLRKIVGASADLGTEAWREQVAGLGNAPHFLVQRLWLDTPVDADRPAFIGTGGMDPIDNISVLERFEDEAAEWATRTGGSVVELHAYAAHGTEDETADKLVTRLHEIYPETLDAKIVDERREWRNDCPMFGLGKFATRPTVRTPEPGLVLAGDGIRIDLPVALMERAATTGFHAANLLLSGWGVAGHELETVPTQGRLAVMRKLGKMFL